LRENRGRRLKSKKIGKKNTTPQTEEQQDQEGVGVQRRTGCKGARQSPPGRHKKVTQGAKIDPHRHAGDTKYLKEIGRKAQNRGGSAGPGTLGGDGLSGQTNEQAQVEKELENGLGKGGKKKYLPISAGRLKWWGKKTGPAKVKITNRKIGVGGSAWEGSVFPTRRKGTSLGNENRNTHTGEQKKTRRRWSSSRTN